MKKLWALLSLLCILVTRVAGAMTVTADGAAIGFSDEITVTLTVTDFVITAVHVDHNETMTIGGQAVERLSEQIVEKNSLNLDVISGATFSSKAILAAAKNALLAAGLDPNDYMDEVEAEPEEPTEPDDDEPVDMPEGAVTGTATGMMGKVTVGLMLNNRRITAVYVDHDDSLSIGGVAAEMLSERIVESNSLNVDVVVGATVTSKAILAAAKNALLAAGLDPNDYMGKDDSATEAGDPDEDGRITVKDAIAVLKYCMGENVSINLDAADVTGDGKVDENDVLRILQYQAGWNVMLN